MCIRDRDKFVLLFFGQIKKVKGVDLLLKAMANIYKKRDDIYLVVAGSVWTVSYTHLVYIRYL